MIEQRDLPNMVDLPNFVRVGPYSSLLVCFDCGVLPAAFQQLIDYFKKLIRDSVPLVMLDSLLESVGLCCTLHERSHNVPSDPPVTNMIERGKLPRKGIRVLVRGGSGNAKGDILGGVGHG